jgi:Ala-tRNA(Pro) deacylase
MAPVGPWARLEATRYALLAKGATMSATELMRELARQEVAYELLPHRRTERATDEAKALGVPPAEVGKTVVLVTPTSRVRAVIPASARIDIHKVRSALGNGKQIRLATEAELGSAYPMFELGAVPPVGGPTGEPVVFDRRLVERDSIVLEAGNHDESVRVATRDVLRATDAEVADLIQD